MTDGAENTIIAHTASIYPFSYSGTIIRPGAAPESGLKGVQRVMAKEYKLSPQRLKELQDEMNYLKTVREKEVAELIKEARSFGDLSENSEYDEAKNEQGKLYSRMAEIEEILSNYVVIEEEPSDGSSTPMDLAAATASSSLLMAMKSMPQYCFTASCIGMRGHPGVRSICSPCHSA